MNKKLFDAIEEKKVLIAAHRGALCGNIIDNTFLSAKAALAMGADIIEMDAIISTDGILYAFHDGEEKIDDIPNYVKRRTLERCMIRR